MSATTSALPLPIATDAGSASRQAKLGEASTNGNANPLSPNAFGRPIRPGPSPLAPSYMMAAAASGASPMSLSMSFGMSYNGGNFGKSWKQSFAGGGMGGFARGAGGAAFGSYAKEGMGSFTMGGIDSNDFFLDPTCPSPSYSFTGLNGSYRSPRGIAMPLPSGGRNQLGNSVGGSYGRETMKLMKKEAEFCKDFICCGKDLGNLHDLLEHYEESHVVVIPSPTTSHMELAMDIDNEHDIDMDDFEDGPSSSSASDTTASTQTSPMPMHATPGNLPTNALKQLALEDVIRANDNSDKVSAFDSFVISSPPNRGSSGSSSGSSSRDLARKAFPGGRISTGTSPNHAASAFAIKSAFGPSVRKASPTTGLTSSGVNPLTAVPPNVLFMSGNGNGQASTSTPQGTTSGNKASSSTSGSVSAASPAAGSITPSSGNGDGNDGEDNNNRKNMPNGEPQPSLFATHRPFRCPQPGCQKSYKQSNGLKYHMSKGQCNFEVRDAVEWGGLTQEEAEEKSRPFVCAAGEGCTKRYRQMNGLKYHYMNSGLHGEVGLILLAQGQHPHPASVPQPTPKPRPSSSTVVSSARNGAVANASGSAFRPGGWVKDAQKAHGKQLGLPMGGNEVRGERKGEEAVLYSIEDEMYA